MFAELMDIIWDEFARVIYHFELTDEAERERAQQQLRESSTSSNTSQFNYSSINAPQYGVGAAVAANMAESALEGGDVSGEPAPGVVPAQPRVNSTGAKAAPPAGFDPDGNPMSRNQPCYCGSGKKFKNCHGK